MKILNRFDFLQCPPGTVFTRVSKPNHKPHYVFGSEELCVKTSDDSWTNDFRYISLSGITPADNEQLNKILAEINLNKEDDYLKISYEDTVLPEYRDGLFESADDVMFVTYDEEEIYQIISTLTNALNQLKSIKQTANQ